MNAFDQTDGQRDQQQTNNESWLEKLVKEKGENWRDPETIAKGKYEADQHIRNLEEQLGELRKDLEQQDYAKQLLSKLQEKATPAVGAKPGANADSPKQGDTNLSASDLTGLIEQILANREQSMTKAQRLEETNKKLVEMFGTEAGKAVKQKAESLGLTVDKLKDLASESPTAFFSLIGEPQAPPSNTIPKGTLNTMSGFNASGERNNSFYQQMRRDKPAEFWSPKTQKQMLEDRKRLGDKFY